MSEHPHTPRVLVFDSGVGSLSIGAEIHRLLPDIDLLYAMDRGGFPYGQWQEHALADHICKQLITLLSREPADMVVMACNSASTVVLPALRAQLTMPVVGVVPAIKPAAQISHSGVIGLLATPGTVARPYTAQLIADFAAHCSVIAVGDGALAPAVEALFWEGRDDPAAWQGAVAKLAAQPRFDEMDTVVLACTHFPPGWPRRCRSGVKPRAGWIPARPLPGAWRNCCRKPARRANRRTGADSRHGCWAA